MDVRTTRRLVALGACGLVGAALWWSIPSLGALRGQPLAAYIPRYLLLGGVYAAAVLVLFRVLAPKSAASLPQPAVMSASTERALLAITWSFAILFRLPLLTTPPTLSDDVYRYMWDGRLQTLGVNPYAHRVDSPALDQFATPNRQRVNNASMASPYLPLAQMMFATVARIAPESELGFQLAAVAFDLAIGLVLVGLLRSLGRSPSWALVYLWNPLVVVEFAHGAHVDAWMTLLMVAACWAEVRAQRHPAAPHAWLSRALAPVLLGLATLVKPIPVVLLPALAPRWGWKRSLLFACTLPVGFLPYAGAGLGLTGDLHEGTGLFGALRIYIARWNFNSGIYHWLEVWLSGHYTAGAVPSDMPGVDLAKGIVSLLMAGVLVATAIVEARQQARGETSRVEVWAVPVAAYLLLTTTVHPWYVAPLIPLLALLASDPSRPATTNLLRILPWMVFSAAVGLSYLTYLDPADLREREIVRLVEYVPLYLLLLAAATPSLRQRWPEIASTFHRIVGRAPYSSSQPAKRKAGSNL